MLFISDRIAADLEMNLRKPLPLLPTLSEENKPIIRLSPLSDCKIELLRSTSDPHPVVSPAQSMPSVLVMKNEPPVVTRFAVSLIDIELQRVKIRDDIKVLLCILNCVVLLSPFRCS
jgi:hypothetical protein